MKEKNSKNIKIARASLVLFLAVVIIAGSFFTYAWLQRETTIKNKTIISDFTIDAKVYFLKGSGTENTMTVEEVAESKPYVIPTGETLVKVNLVDRNADNFIGNLRVLLTFTGSSPAYIRAKVFEQWSEKDVFIENAKTPYTIPETNEEIFIYEIETSSIFTPSFIDEKTTQQGTGWFDNRQEDFGFYYNAPVYPRAEARTVKMLLINGISDKNIDEMSNTRNGVEMQFLIKAEAVQPNRFREFFEMEKLPWEK